MKNIHRLTRRNLAWLFALCLVVSTLLSACSSDKDGSSKADADKAVVSDEQNAKQDDSQPTVQPTTAAPAASTYEWPKDFSLAETYKDDFLIGTIYTDSSRSGKDKELLLKQFNTITPENLMKPEYMQPSEGNFSYGAADTMVQFAADNNLNVVGHNLAWHQQTGNWLGRNVSRDEAIAQLKSHITNIVSHYKGQLISWDVVNEAINDGVTLPADGDWTKCLRQTQWYTSIGPDYMEMAYKFAREADPDVKLYYNDYNLNNKSKADIVYAMVKDFKKRGIPIDGIGMQGHYSTDTSIGSVEYSLNKFSELGVEVSVTELDVTVKGASTSGLSEAQEKAQAIEYAKLFQLYKKYKDLIARVTFWGTVDNKSWRKESFPCLFNSDYSPKQAVYAVLDPDKYLELNANSGSTGAKAEVKTAQAKYGTPVIDGEIDDVWNSCTPAQINSQLTAWQGATGTVRILWDENFVYELFEVKDSVLNQSSVNAYEQDSIETYLDQKNEKSSYYDDNDGQYRVNYAGAESFGTIPSMQGFVSAAKQTDGGYLIELAIPLMVKASEGTIMGFEAQINDSNASGVRQAIAKFNDTTDNSYQSTELWGNLKLVK